MPSTLDYNPDSITDFNFNFDFKFNFNFNSDFDFHFDFIFDFSYTSTHSREARLKKILASGKSVGIVPMSNSYRSEERRVGKEC